MAEPISKFVLKVLLKECKANSCPFRAGDGQEVRKKLGDAIDSKIKHELETKIEQLEKDKMDLKAKLAAFSKSTVQKKRT